MSFADPALSLVKECGRPTLLYGNVDLYDDFPGQSKSPAWWKLFKMLRRKIKHAIMKRYLVVLIVCGSLINVLLYLFNNDKSIEVLPKLYSQETLYNQETLYSHFDFQAVHEHSIIVYSAHLNDVSAPPVVTVIGLGVLKKIPPNVTCRYTGSVLTNERNNSLSRNATLETTGEVVALPEHHNEMLV